MVMVGIYHLIGMIGLPDFPLDIRLREAREKRRAKEGGGPSPFFHSSLFSSLSQSNIKGEVSECDCNNNIQYSSSSFA